MRHVLWIGDAGVDSGFARGTHSIVPVLQKRGWQTSVLGLNYMGDKHGQPFDIYPCYPGGDPFGLGRVAELVTQLRPSLVVVQNDPWNFPQYLKRVGNVPTVGFVAVDGMNCPGRSLNGLRLAIFWTEFGRREAQLGGYHGYSSVVPLGVNLDMYMPRRKAESLKALGLPSMLNDAFIIGNVNRNQPRKRLDLTVMAFAEFVRRYRVDNAYLYMHIAPTGDQDGYDVSQLMAHYGLASRLILVTVGSKGRGAKEEKLAQGYSIMDVQLNTAQGEGWGLTTMEGMASGVPQIFPDFAALGEWAKPAGIAVPCVSYACTPNQINVIGGVVDINGVVDALHLLYKDPGTRAHYGSAGVELTLQDRFRWENIGHQFCDSIDKVVEIGVSHLGD